MSSDGQLSKLSSEIDALEDLLIKQKKLVQRGNMNDVEMSIEQADEQVKRILKEGIFKFNELAGRKKKLQELYEDLRLALAVQKADTGQELSKIRKGKKTLEVYHNNI